MVFPGASVTIAFFVLDRLPNTPLNLLTLPFNKIVLTAFTFTEKIFSIDDLTSSFVALTGTEGHFFGLKLPRSLSGCC